MYRVMLAQHLIKHYVQHPIYIFLSIQHGNLTNFNHPLRKPMKTNNCIFLNCFYTAVLFSICFSVLLEHLDVNRFGTRFTLLNANDASIIVNTTSSMSDFYTLWNQTNHQTQSAGLNLNEIIKQLGVIGKNLLEEEHKSGSLSGRSFIALIVPQMAGVNEADANNAMYQIESLREQQPDLSLLFWAGGSPGRFARFVRDQQKDVFQLMAFSTIGADSSQQILANAAPVIQRIQSGMII